MQQGQLKTSLVRKNNLCYVPATIGNTTLNTLLDTGAKASVLPTHLLPKNQKSFPLTSVLHGFSKHPITISRAAHIPVTVNNHTYIVLFRLVPLNVPPILGMDFCCNFDTQIGLQNFQMTLNTPDHSVCNTDVKNRKHNHNITAKLNPSWYTF